jgi:hypothetical protein
MGPQRLDHAQAIRWQLAATLAAVLCLGAGTSAEAAPPADEGLVARWPATADDQGFDGGRFVALPSAADVGQGPFSVSVWLNADDLARGDPTYGRGVARSTRGEQVGDWLLSVHPDGRVRFCNWRHAGADADGSHVTQDPLVMQDSWYYVVATWDGTATHIFVNGVEAKHAAGTTASGWETGHEVGRSWTQPGYYWVGQIDGLRLHRRARAAAEIAADFRANPRLQPRLTIRPAGDPRVSDALDHEILARLQEQHVTAAPLADDAEFHRRVTLDLAGRIPTPAETEAFLADHAPDKRAKLVDTLLGGREMPLYWSQVLSGWLMPPEGRRDEKFLGYLRRGLANNKSWDRFVREMILARPSGPDDQYASCFLSYRKAAVADGTIARDLGRALFGVNLRCAQCHDHPHVPEWTRQRFLGLSAFFIRSFEHPYTDAAKQPLIAFGEKATGELESTSKGGHKRVVRPTFLDGTVVEEPPAAEGAAEPAAAPGAPPPVPPFSRRAALARLALDPRSPYLKRALVNRVWRQLMGRGLVEPVDMMHEGNPATHPRLLDLLADDFADHGFDLRRLIGVVMHSEAYARSSRWPGGNDLPDERLYAAAVLKPLDADQFALSLPLATGYYDAQLGGHANRTMAQVRPAAGWPEIVAEFNAQADAFEPTATQALFLLNSDYVQKQFVADSNLVKSLSALPADADIARRAYLAILSRPPSPEETAQVSRYLADRGAGARPEACRELVWALFSGPEFRFNH